MTDEHKPGSQSLHRLRDQHSHQDLEVAHAARLVGSVRQREISDEQADRVWRRVQGAGRAGRSRSGAFWLRPAVVGAVLVGMASMALASVTIGRRWSRWMEERRSAQGRLGTGESAAGKGTGGVAAAAIAPLAEAVGAPSLPSSAAAVAAPVATPSQVEPSLLPPAPLPSLSPSGTAPHPRSRRLAAGPDPAAAVAATLNSPDVQLIMDAVNAFRRDGDHERARMHLTLYLRRFPDGLFYEEALALAIEAAEKSRETIEATSLAESYLKRYPDGRYRANAARLAGASKAGR